MWQSDNAIFNVNGEGLDKLRLTLELAFSGKTIIGYQFKIKKGLVFYNYESSEKFNKVSNTDKPRTSR